MASIDRPDAEPDLLEKSAPDQPARRPGRWLLPVAAAGAIGLVVGYVVGTQHGPSRTTTTPGATRTASPSPSSAASPVPVTGPAFAGTGATCSEQRGRRLELGAQVQNLSQSVVHITGVKARTPLAGRLRALGAHVGVCAETADRAVSADSAAVLPGATTWLTATVRVLVTCPTPYPVEYLVHYQRGARSRTETIRGFNDLAGVSYTGCAHAR